MDLHVLAGKCACLSGVKRFCNCGKHDVQTKYRNNLSLLSNNSKIGVRRCGHDIWQGPKRPMWRSWCALVASGETGHQVSSFSEKENRRFNMIIYIGNTLYYYCVVNCNNIMLPSEVHITRTAREESFEMIFYSFFCEKFNRRCRRRRMERDNTSSQYSHWIFYNTFFNVSESQTSYHATAVTYNL